MSNCARTDMAPWRILADDLTGALDCAAPWSAHGPVDLGLENPLGLTSRVQGVATGSRQRAPQDLAAVLAPCLDWFCAGEHSFKKIDSLLRGNTWAEIAWLLDSGRFKGAVLAPAFAAQGRFSRAGRHWVGPPHAPEQAPTEVLPVALHRGLEAFGHRAALCPPGSDLLGPGPALRVPDVLCDGDMDALAALAHSPAGRGWLWCASAGLAWALNRRQRSAANGLGAGEWADLTGESNGATLATPGRAAATDPGPDGIPWLISASRHPVLRQQLQALAAAPAHRCLDGADAEPLAPQAAALRLRERAAQWVQAPPPQRLLVVGGDTLLALVQASGAQRLQALPGRRLGWGCARWLGGRWDGVVSHTRSGAFGPPDDLLLMLAAVR